MTKVLNPICVEKNYTYQHIHGCLLLGLNMMASTSKLSHSEYRIMAVLIGYYSKSYGKAYPTTRQLVKDCCMSNTTLNKGLNKLNELGLIMIVKDSQFRRQQYHINKQKFLYPSSATNMKTTNVTTCDSAYKLIDNKTNNKKLSSINQKTAKLNKNDDESIKTTNKSDYKEVMTKLDSWGYTGAKKLLKQKGVEIINKLIELVENKNPDNKGAYLRTLISIPGIKAHLEAKSSYLDSDDLHIKQMLKHQYWKHLPTGEIYKVKPDIGTHLLIRYYKNENMVELLEGGLIDKIDKFEVY